ncbi:hypothetical protein ACQPZF_11010 [Actinosynnema sp. CS-041913]|uniref:hypothetical protein n=1 Tax=Actinosynnema sp. CS-041913 TaxID=3239917 RepID=UPI003D93BECB
MEQRRPGLAPTGHLPRHRRRRLPIHEGATLGGERAWSAQAGVGTTKGREKPISLTGHYRMAWRDFSTLDHTVGGRMRLIVVKAEKTAQDIAERPADLS